MNRRQYDSGRRDWNEAVTSQVMPIASRGWKRQQMGCPLKTPEGTDPASTLTLAS